MIADWLDKAKQDVAWVVAVGQGSRKDSVIPTLQKIFDNSKRERLTTVVNKIHAETRRTSQRSPFKKIHQKVVRPTVGESVVDQCLLQKPCPNGHGTERTEAT